MSPGHDHKGGGCECPLLGGLQPGGGLEIEADLRGQRQMDQPHDIQACGDALDLVWEGPERKAVDKYGRAVADARKNPSRVIPCRRRGNWKAVIELMNVDGPAAIAEPCDDPTVVLVTACPALE